jgi:MarR family transcriptional regulator, organic hydroperoxide resistance regulator
MSNNTKAQLIERVALEFRKSLAGAILFNQKVAADVGMNPTDMQCLHLLQLQGSATPGEFARWSRMSTGGVTVMLDRLEAAGYVKRDPNPNDRRSTVVSPIPSGLQRLHAIYREKGQHLQKVLSTYTERELRLIGGFFEAINSIESQERMTSAGHKTGRRPK